VIGTVFFSGVFVWLTVDTALKVPEQTRDKNITEEVKRGKIIWEKNNCMGCHTIMGEGAYYAPELTKAYERRGEEWLSIFLKDPEKMYPNERKMVNYHFTDGEIKDVIAFLKWVGEVDLNGFPAKPTLQKVQANVAAKAGVSEHTAPEKFKLLCTACHSVQGKGGNVGPALDGVANKYDHQYLDKWLLDPFAVKKDTKMPKLPLTDAERNDIVSYLLTLK
jgi:nitric oxide reductase subunit C